MNQKLIYGLLFILVTSGLKAQNEAITAPQMMYLSNHQIGINLNTFGMGGISYRYGWHKTGFKQNHFEVELARVKHPKEIRRTGFSENPVKYSFGRENVVFFLRTSLGQTVTLTERPYKNALGLNFVYSAGLNTALLKPVYLDVYYPNESGYGGYLVSEKYDPEKHNDIFRIYGNSSFFSGIGETKFMFGAAGKAGLSVEWGQYQEEYKSIDAGITVDLFSQGLPMMAYQEKPSLFIGLYVGFNWGFRK